MKNSMTYDEILSRMLASAPNGIDVSRGSIFYDAVCPVAAELSRLYGELYDVLGDAFPDTCGEDALLRHAEALGLVREPATHAVIIGRFDVNPAAGSRFMLGRHVYVLGDFEEEYGPGRYRYRLVCETAGSAPNGDTDGTLVPLSYIEGMTICAFDKLYTAGQDAEEIESLRRRVIAARVSSRFGGNRDDYIAAISAIPGVGGVKIYPAWNGGGTVRAVIMGDGGTVPSTELVASVKKAVDDTIAPIGHTVTVAGVSSREVTVSVTPVYADGWDAASAKDIIEDTVRGYVAELCDAWSKSASLTLRISQLQSRLYDTGCVSSLSAVSFGGGSGDVALGADVIPVYGSVVIS